MSTYCLLILNCKKYEHKRQRQRSTWLKYFPLKLWFHVRGDPSQKEEYIIDISQNLLIVNIEDDYVSLCKKSFLALKAVYESFPHVTHVLKTDDDMDCNINNYMNINMIFPKFDYGGFIVENSQDGWSTYHYHDSVEKVPKKTRKGKSACGRFYFVNRRAIAHILNQRDLFWDNDTVFEDNTVGFALGSLEDLKIMYIQDKFIFFEYPDQQVH